MQTTFRPDEDEYVEPAPADCPPPPLSDYPDGPTLAEMEAAIVRGSCAYCGATRPMSELELVATWINGVYAKRLYCFEYRTPFAAIPICAWNAEVGAEG